METITNPTFQFNKGQLQVIPLPEEELPHPENFNSVHEFFRARDKYFEAVAYARAHPVPVHEKDVEKIKWQMFLSVGKIRNAETLWNAYKSWQPQKHTDYKIEVSMEIKETCKWNGNRDACGNETCWDLNECQYSPPKQVACLIEDDKLSSECSEFCGSSQCENGCANLEVEKQNQEREEDILIDLKNLLNTSVSYKEILTKFSVDRR